MDPEPTNPAPIPAPVPAPAPVRKAKPAAKPAADPAADRAKRIRDLQTDIAETEDELARLRALLKAEQTPDKGPAPVPEKSDSQWKTLFD